MTAQSAIQTLKSKTRLYWPLIKSMQTGLLLSTGIAGYLSAHTQPEFWVMLGMAGSLFLSISGSTILNMWWQPGRARSRRGLLSDRGHGR